jgi:hypothetical protein
MRTDTMVGERVLVTNPNSCWHGATGTVVSEVFPGPAGHLAVWVEPAFLPGLPWVPGLRPAMPQMFRVTELDNQAT